MVIMATAITNIGGPVISPFEASLPEVGMPGESDVEDTLLVAGARANSPLTQPTTGTYLSFMPQNRSKVLGVSDHTAIKVQPLDVESQASETQSVIRESRSCLTSEVQVLEPVAELDLEDLDIEFCHVGGRLRWFARNWTQITHEPHGLGIIRGLCKILFPVMHLSFHISHDRKQTCWMRR